MNKNKHIYYTFQSLAIKIYDSFQPLFECDCYRDEAIHRITELLTGDSEELEFPDIESCQCWNDE